MVDIKGSYYKKDPEVEPFAVMRTVMTKEQYSAYLHGSMLAYYTRYLLAKQDASATKDRGSVADLKKISVYLHEIAFIYACEDTSLHVDGRVALDIYKERWTKEDRLFLTLCAVLGGKVADYRQWMQDFIQNEINKSEGEV